MLHSSSSLQLFDETFVNYGFNKVQWIESLRYSGYEFYVLNNGFLIDMPHKSYGYYSLMSFLGRCLLNGIILFLRRVI